MASLVYERENCLAETCEVGTLKDDLIRNKVVCGVRENTIRRRLLQESGLSLSKCVDIFRANEATAAQLKVMASSQTTEQEASSVNQKESSKKPKAPKENGKDAKASNATTVVISTSGKKQMSCIRKNVLFVWKSQH